MRVAIKEYLPRDLAGRACDRATVVMHSQISRYPGRVVVLIWTERDDRAHLISCRYADKHETQRYLAAL